MGKPAIPAYGKSFRWEEMPFDENWARRRYVLKSNVSISISSTRDSKSWSIFIDGIPRGVPSRTMREAMPRAIAIGELLS